MPNYGNSGGGVIPAVLSLMDQIKARKYLNSPEGQAALASFQTNRTPSPDLVARAAKYPEVSQAFQNILASLPVKSTIEATEAGTGATRLGTQQSAADFTKLGMTPQAVNAKANQGQVDVQQKALAAREQAQVADLLQAMLGTTFDPKQRKNILQAGSSIQGPVGDFLRTIISAENTPSAADQAILNALRQGQPSPALNQPGGPIGPPLPPSKALGPLQSPVLTPQGQQALDRVKEFLMRLFSGGSSTPSVSTPQQKLKDLYR